MVPVENAARGARPRSFHELGWTSTLVMATEAKDGGEAVASVADDGAPSAVGGLDGETSLKRARPFATPVATVACDAPASTRKRSVKAASSATAGGCCRAGGRDSRFFTVG